MVQCKMGFLILLLASLLGTASCAALTARSAAVTPCFTPAGCTDSIAAEIGNARSEVFILASTLTSKDVADAIVKAKDAGANVMIIMDRSSAATQGSASYFAQIKGIPTYIDAKHAAAHSNFAVIDGEKVITGGYSFTKESEERYSEDLVIISSSSLAEAYRTNWTRHRDHAEEFKQVNGQHKTEQAKKKEPKRKKTAPR